MVPEHPLTIPSKTICWSFKSIFPIISRKHVNRSTLKLSKFTSINISIMNQFTSFQRLDTERTGREEYWVMWEKVPLEYSIQTFHNQTRLIIHVLKQDFFFFKVIFPFFFCRLQIHLLIFWFMVIFLINLLPLQFKWNLYPITYLRSI